MPTAAGPRLSKSKYMAGIQCPKLPWWKVHGLVEKGALYRALRRLRGRLPWQGNVDAGRRSRASRG